MIRMESNTEAVARRAPYDSAPDANAHSPFWQHASVTHFDGDFFGKPIAGHASQVLLQWTSAYLYLLFVCPYETLHLKPNPNLADETFALWDWDVAEVFIGHDFANIRRYAEFEVSPQGEWVDLAIDRDRPVPEDGWVWKSGCTVAARIDESAKVWYGFMQIPWSAIDPRPAAAGNLLRINFFRCQGADPGRKYIAWQAPGKPSFHVPETFGTLRLID
jgi:hypothetical protein